MQRIAHGSTAPVKIGEPAPEEIITTLHPSTLAGGTSTSIPFDYLFPELQNDPSCRLPESQETLLNLTRLGASMQDRDNDSNFDSNIPSAYTYFGQFIDHDISFTKTEGMPPNLSDSCFLDVLNLRPWPKSVVLNRVMNRRAALLDLDCVYGGDPSPPRYGRLFVVGKVSEFHHRPRGKDEDNDLPRQGMSRTPQLDRAALIGDPRNDQNLIVSQLHLAFLRAHNAIVRQGHTWEEARTLLRQHFHWIIIHDYLKKQIADPNIVDNVLASSNPRYNPPAHEFFLPLEFSVAAFRFGHSMIRSVYYLNKNFLAGGIPLEMLFTLTALSDDVKPTPGMGLPTLPENRIIEWRRFLSGGENSARRIDTRLSKPLFALLDENEEPVDCERGLAILDLKRGYLLRMPTGQAVAQALNLPVLTPQQIEAVAEKDKNPGQRQVLASGFSGGTPLWFYVLAEAADGGKQRLGPVGSRLVAEVLIGLVRRSRESILDQNNPPWRPTLGPIPGEFNLPDLLRLAGVLEDKY